MKRAGASILLFLVFCASGVAAQEVAYSFSQRTDFSKFETYKWVSVMNPAQEEGAMMHQIRFEIDQQLATKGLLKTDSDKADLYVVCQNASGAEGYWIAYGPGWPLGPQWGGTKAILTNTLHPGEVDLDLFDATNKTLVWRGVVTKAIDPKLNDDKREKNLQKAIEKLLSNYPPKAK